MNSNIKIKLAGLALLGVALLGAGCVRSDNGKIDDVVSIIPTSNKIEVSTTVTAEISDWRQLLDMTKAKMKILESGKTSLLLPPLFFEPNNANTDVPDMSYALREEALVSFPSSDTPWHTSKDIAEEKAFIAGGKAVPSIHSEAEKIVRYSEGGIQGYYGYDCLKAEGENALSTVFTFFDQTHRYRLELLEAKPEWSSQETFAKTCVERITKIEQGNLDQESTTKYQVLKKIVETIKKN
jgi:hypothetical protein